MFSLTVVNIHYLLKILFCFEYYVFNKNDHLIVVMNCVSANKQK